MNRLPRVNFSATFRTRVSRQRSLKLALLQRTSQTETHYGLFCGTLYKEEPAARIIVYNIFYNIFCSRFRLFIDTLVDLLRRMTNTHALIYFLAAVTDNRVVRLKKLNT